MDVSKQVLLITNIPTPYRLPLYAELHHQLQARGKELIVIFGDQTYKRRKWEVSLESVPFAYEVLSTRKIGDTEQSENAVFLYQGLLPIIQKHRPQAVVTAGFNLATVRASLLKNRFAFKHIIWSGTILHHRAKQSWLRQKFRSWLAKRVDGAVAYGSKAYAYLVHLGIPEDRISIGINTVDTSFFEEETQVQQSAAPSLTERSCKQLTFTGYLHARKNVLAALKVIRGLAERRQDFVFNIIGDGPEMPSLKQYVAAHNLEAYVRFHGYRQTEELPTFLAMSDLFLFQTDFDIWGLVLNEAMAAGVACVASINAGATFDLIEEGVTGYAIDFSQTSVAVDLIDSLLSDPVQTAALGRKAKTFVTQHANLSISAQGFVEAIENVTQKSTTDQPIERR